MSELFDPGLQPERTALAWRRTALSVVVGSAIAARLLDPVLGGWGATVGGAGAAVGVWLFLVARRRSRQVSWALRRDGDLHAGPDASALAVLAATSGLGGVAALVVVLVR